MCYPRGFIYIGCRFRSIPGICIVQIVHRCISLLTVFSEEFLFVVDRLISHEMDLVSLPWQRHELSIRPTSRDVTDPSFRFKISLVYRPLENLLQEGY